MKWNFRLGWFRIEVLPRFKIVFDVRRTVAGKRQNVTSKRNNTVKSTVGQPVKKKGRPRKYLKP